MTKTRPFLKWAGNKYRCLHQIFSVLPPATRFIEPFAGSAAVFLNTSYSSYLLGEENKDLINLFHQLQQEGEAFINTCQKYFSKENNTASAYYALREQFNVCEVSSTRAALFLYLNRHGYNGLCRYNQQGIYNVPFGSYLKPYFPAKEMLHFHKKSQQATIVHSDFRDTFNLAKPGDVIYCDPPYAPIPTQDSNFTSYTAKKFGEPEQILLSELAVDSASRGITVVISNHDTPFTRKQYQQGIIHSFPVTRLINCHGMARTPAQELLAVFIGTR